ncbi:hypothetical protein KAW18_10035 [candidate division WOR-3 bacterium]|nr:hypothetical protein [candidate division WOR-3 bacterium]
MNEEHTTLHFLTADERRRHRYKPLPFDSLHFQRMNEVSPQRHEGHKEDEYFVFPYLHTRKTKEKNKIQKIGRGVQSNATLLKKEEVC